MTWEEYMHHAKVDPSRPEWVELNKNYLWVYFIVAILFLAAAISFANEPTYGRRISLNCQKELTKHPRRMWLSRQRDGNYMMTHFKPEKSAIFGSEYDDFYILHGEPIGVRHLCAMGVKAIFGIEIPIGTQVRVWVTGGMIE